jgi:hypothetical protein
MEFNKLLFGGLALGCLAAAGAGGYLAARQTPATPTAAPTVEPASPAAGTTAAPRAVAESEGVIGPEAGTTDAAAAAPAAGAAPAPGPTRGSRGWNAAPGRPAESPVVITPRRESTPRPTRPSPAPRSATSASRSARNEEPAPAPSPSSNAPAPPSGGMWEPRASVEPERAPIAEPEPEFVELVIPADAVLGLQIERTVSSELARVEDRVDARVTRDVRVEGRVAIPAGSVAHGSVMEVERGGKVRDRAKLGIRFHTVVLADGTRLNIRTDSVVREGSAPAKESAAKIGGAAAGGAILGAILGGGKGAVIGGTIGAAGGTAATMAGNRNPAVLPAGTTVSVRMQQPVTVTVEQ